MAEGIAEAQRQGIAEADASFDIDGWDSAAKTAALANVLMDAQVTPLNVEREGIGTLTPAGMQALAVQRKTVSLVSRARRTETGFHLQVRPEVLDDIDLLAAPPNKSNILLLDTDEMGTIGSLTMVEQAFGLMAGIGVRIWAFLQDLPQLKRDYPASWETFISNSSLIQALQVTDLTTSQYLSELIGTTTLERYSAESLHVREKNPDFKGMADQVHGRALLLPQEIRGLKPNQVLSIMPNAGNFLLPREPYYGPESPWAGLYRSPPRFAAANAAPPPPPPAPPSPEPPKRRGLFG